MFFSTLLYVCALVHIGQAIESTCGRDYADSSDSFDGSTTITGSCNTLFTKDGEVREVSTKYQDWPTGFSCPNEDNLCQQLWIHGNGKRATWLFTPSVPGELAYRKDFKRIQFSQGPNDFKHVDLVNVLQHIEFYVGSITYPACLPEQSYLGMDKLALVQLTTVDITNHMTCHPGRLNAKLVKSWNTMYKQLVNIYASNAGIIELPVNFLNLIKENGAIQKIVLDGNPLICDNEVILGMGEIMREEDESTEGGSKDFNGTTWRPSYEGHQKLIDKMGNKDDTYCLKGDGGTKINVRYWKMLKRMIARWKNGQDNVEKASVDKISDDETKTDGADDLLKWLRLLRLPTFDEFKNFSGGNGEGTPLWISFVWFGITGLLAFILLGMWITMCCINRDHNKRMQRKAMMKQLPSL